MNFHQHPSNNKVFGAPNGWDQTRVPCGALPVTLDAEAGVPVIRSFWKPDALELAALNAGNSVVLTILGSGMPPVCLGVEACA